MVWTLLDIGSCLPELAFLAKAYLDRQGHRIRACGKGRAPGVELRAPDHPPVAAGPASHRGPRRPARDAGSDPRTIQRVIRQAQNDTQIARKLTLHLLHQTFSITAIHKRVPLTALQCLLGHDRPTASKICLNLSPEDVIREFQATWESWRARS